MFKMSVFSVVQCNTGMSRDFIEMALKERDGSMVLIGLRMMVDPEPTWPVEHLKTSSAACE